jgi:hypothetical protein
MVSENHDLLRVLTRAELDAPGLRMEDGWINTKIEEPQLPEWVEDMIVRQWIETRYADGCWVMRLTDRGRLIGQIAGTS